MSEVKKGSISGYIQQDEEFDYLKNVLNSIEKGTSIGILLYGPPGIGKTLLAISLAKEFNASYYIVDGSPELDRRDLEGNWELFAGNTKFNYGPLTRAILDANEKGIAFIIINEINAIRESEQISLNSILSENHINLISKGFEKFELNPESKLIIIGTMNKGVVGINKLQEAFEDRFIICPELNYPTEPKEIDIVSKISGCPRKLAELVVDAARQIRNQALQDFSVSKIFSTRLIVNFCMLISKMPSNYLKHNIENMIINKLGETPEEKKSIAMILDGKMFEGKLKKILQCESEDKPKLVVNPNQNPEGLLISQVKSAFIEFSELFGRNHLMKKNGDILWEAIYWMWRNKKELLQTYLKLTEKLRLNEFYKAGTGNNHLYRGKVSLAFIKWLYVKRSNDLYIFLHQLYPVL